MKKIREGIIYLYKHKTTLYSIKRNFNQLIGQLDAASNDRTEITNPNIKQPALISGLTINHYVPNKFRADCTSHFIGRNGFTQSHLYGTIEKISENEVRILLRQVPSFEMAYLLPLAMLLLTGFILTVIFTKGFSSYVLMLIVLEIAATLIFFANRKMLNMLDYMCIEYIRSGKEFTI